MIWSQSNWSSWKASVVSGSSVLASSRMRSSSASPAGRPSLSRGGCDRYARYFSYFGSSSRLRSDPFGPTSSITAGSNAAIDCSLGRQNSSCTNGSSRHRPSRRLTGHHWLISGR